ncbi:MAG: GIY-YIG nuclease family protein [Emcibacteraceae bacterium]|nr:GIY-YIG nuclease family protein [Emcibacteraceae bacterium]
MSKIGFTYILASKKHGTLYIGVTSVLMKRIWQHKEGAAESFTKEYEVKTLVYFEQFAGIKDAIAREKQLKQWRWDWKVALIEESNPEWRDLYLDINGP